MFIPNSLNLIIDVDLPVPAALNQNNTAYKEVKLSFYKDVLDELNLIRDAKQFPSVIGRLGFFS